jgi:hypothetical protein
VGIQSALAGGLGPAGTLELRWPVALPEGGAGPAWTAPRQDQLDLSPQAQALSALGLTPSQANVSVQGERIRFDLRLDDETMQVRARGTWDYRARQLRLDLDMQQITEEQEGPTVTSLRAKLTFRFQEEGASTPPQPEPPAGRRPLARAAREFMEQAAASGQERDSQAVHLLMSSEEASQILKDSAAQMGVRVLELVRMILAINRLRQAPEASAGARPEPTDRERSAASLQVVDLSLSWDLRAETSS